MHRFGAFVFDPDQRLLSRDGAAVHLTPKAFDLLGLLIGAAPRVVPKAELHERLWPTSFVSDATLVGLVKELRRALDDRDQKAPVIRTVPRVGYGFCRTTTTAAPQPGSVSSWLLVAGKRIPLHEGENTVGRDPLSAVWIDIASVSRRHARIVCSGLQAVLEDMGSKNGTMVGTDPVRAARELRDGDRIVFGRVDAVYFASASGVPTVTVGDWSPQKTD
jgi:DNA-binding winged helix-turn-helix (wHTH) protein